MIKLKNSGALVSLEGVRLVKKTEIFNGVAYRSIEITYVDGGVVEVGYGGDDHYYNTHNPKLDEDYRQIEEELLVEQ